MAVLDLQRRGQQIGRIRIGVQVLASSGRMRPEKLETFRFTTQSRPSADAIAALYGGDVREWNGEWEVITRESAIGVTVPPRDQVVSQFYEMWSKGGAQRRCDSRTDQISGKPCLCPHAADPGDDDEVARKAVERSVLASRNPPEACKLVTRISVMIPDLPGLGVFRLDTGSYYAGVEIGDAAALMELARDRGVFLPAMLRIEQRSRVAAGKTKKYPVPVLEVLATFRQIASGQLEQAGIMHQLPPVPARAPRAITAAPAAPVAADGPAGDAAGDAAERAESIAVRARAAATRPEITALASESNTAGVGEEYVEDAGSDTFVQLSDYLRDRWRELPEAGPPPAPPRPPERCSTGQVSMIRAQFERIGMDGTDPAEILGFTASLAGRAAGIADIAELDPDEARKVREALRSCDDRGGLVALLAAPPGAAAVTGDAPEGLFAGPGDPD